MDKRQELYNLYLSKGLITEATTFEQFSAADEAQMTALYDLGKGNELFKTTDYDTFKGAWTPVKKKDSSEVISEDQPLVSEQEVGTSDASGVTEDINEYIVPTPVPQAKEVDGINVMEFEPPNLGDQEQIRLQEKKTAARHIPNPSLVKANRIKKEQETAMMLERASGVEPLDDNSIISETRAALPGSDVNKAKAEKKALEAEKKALEESEALDLAEYLISKMGLKISPSELVKDKERMKRLSIVNKKAKDDPYDQVDIYEGLSEYDIPSTKESAEFLGREWDPNAVVERDAEIEKRRKKKERIFELRDAYASEKINELGEEIKETDYLKELLEVDGDEELAKKNLKDGLNEIGNLFLTDTERSIKKLQTEIDNLEAYKNDGGTWNEKQSNAYIEKVLSIQAFKKERELGTSQLFDPLTGTFIQNERADKATVDFNKTLNEELLKYEDSGRGDLEKRRNELYYMLKTEVMEILLRQQPKDRNPLNVRRDGDGNVIPMTKKEILDQSEIYSKSFPFSYGALITGGSRNSGDFSNWINVLNSPHLYTDEQKADANELYARFLGINRALNLNEDPGTLREGDFIEGVVEAFDKTLDGTKGEKFDKAEVFMTEMKSMGIPLTEQQEREMGQSFSKSLGSTVAESAILMVDIAAGSYLLGGTGSALRIPARIRKLSKTLGGGNKAMQFGYNLALQSAAYEMAGQSAFSGAGEYAAESSAGAALEKLGSKNAMVNFILKLAAGTGGETIAEYTGGFAENFAKSGDIQIAAEDTFGKTVEEREEIFWLTFTTSLMFSSVGLTSREIANSKRNARNMLIESGSQSPIVLEGIEILTKELEAAEEQKTSLTQKKNEAVSAVQNALAEAKKSGGEAMVDGKVVTEATIKEIEDAYESKVSELEIVDVNEYRRTSKDEKNTEVKKLKEQIEGLRDEDGLIPQDKKTELDRLNKAIAEVEAQTTSDVGVTDEAVFDRIKEIKGEYVAYTQEEFDNIKKILEAEYDAKIKEVEAQPTSEVEVLKSEKATKLAILDSKVAESEKTGAIPVDENGDALMVKEEKAKIEAEYDAKIKEVEAQPTSEVEAKEAEIEEKSNLEITPENSSNYANMTEDGEGNFVFYHKGAKDYETIKPSSSSDATSKAEAAATRKVGGVSMYYTSESDGEAVTSGREAKYMVRVPKEKVYDANTDNLGLAKEAKERHAAEYPGQGYDANTEMAYMTKIAAEKGFDMIVGEWDGKTRAQTTKEMTPSDVMLIDGNTVTQKFKEKFEDNKKKGYESFIPETKTTALDAFYKKLNKERNKEGTYDDIYRLTNEASSKSQEQISKEIEESDISQELKDEYKAILDKQYDARKSSRNRTDAVTVDNSPKGAFVNVGMIEGNDGREMSETEIEAHLPEGVTVKTKKRIEIGQGVDEPTLSMELSRPLTDSEMITFREGTNQIAIPQIVDGQGTMHGTTEWGDFNPEYFITPEGKKLSEVATTTQKRGESLAAEFKEMEASKKDTSKIEEQVENAKKAIAKVSPKTTIVVHKTAKDYKNSGKNRKQDEGGEYDIGKDTIHINLESANERTVAHELFHALLLNKGMNDKQAKSVTDNMLKAVKKTASPELLKKLEDFSGRYILTDEAGNPILDKDGNTIPDPVQSEESIAELFGILAAGYPTLPKPTQNIIKRWLDKLAKLFGLKMFTDNEVVDMLNVVSKKIKEGVEISEKELKPIRKKVDLEKEFEGGIPVDELTDEDLDQDQTSQWEVTPSKTDPKGNLKKPSEKSSKNLKSRKQNIIKNVKESVSPGQTVSTRLPKTDGVHSSNEYIVGISSLENLANTNKAAEAQYIKIANEVSSYSLSKINSVKSFDDAKKVIKEFKEVVKSNLEWLHNSFNKDVRDISKLWYDGANKIANELSSKYEYSIEQVSGVMAVLSPQMDWFRNLSLGERVIDIYSKQKESLFDSKMLSYVANSTTGTGKNKKPLFKDAKAIINRVKDKKLSELTSKDKAYFIRVFDEVYNSREYNNITPNGEINGLVRKKDGTPGAAGWGAFSTIEKSISILENGAIENISANLGKMHKVRNFFNNISNPNDKDAVTIDTHAVAAALLLPLSGSSKQVAYNFGGAGNVGSGMTGTYPVYAEAYRELAKELDLLPRELQSITWEAVRGLFKPSFKSVKSNESNINTFWEKYNSGDSSLEETHGEVSDLAGGISKPVWFEYLADNNLKSLDENSAAMDQASETDSRNRKQLPADTQRSRKQRTTRLAPNKKQSNLTDVQYDAVRTPAFKKWFGDWETDPANASKVVDENGEPLVVYHGSAAPDIEVFDRLKSGRQASGLKEMGIYFSTNPELSNIYAKSERSKDYDKEVRLEIYQLKQALYKTRSNRDYDAITKRIELLESKGKVYPVFLNIRDMVTFDAKFDANIEAWRNLKVKASYKTATGRDAMEFLSPQISKERNLERFGVKPVDGIKAENIVDASYSYSEGSDNVYPTVTQEVKDTQDYKDFAKKYGGDVFLLFDGQPENIKLADGSNTTFDPESNNIRKQLPADDLTKIEAVRKLAQERGYTEAELKAALEALGFSKEEINSTKEKSIADAQEKFDTSIKRGNTKADAVKSALGDLESTTWYRITTDTKRDAAVKELKKSLGEKIKKAPSVKKIMGDKSKPEKQTKTVKSLRKEFWKMWNKAFRDSKIDQDTKRKEISEAISDIINESRGDAVVKKKKLDAIQKRINRTNLNNPVMVERLLNYIEKVMVNADHIAKIAEANKNKTRIRKLTKKGEKDANLTASAKAFIQIDPNLVEDIDLYLEKSNEIVDGLKPTSITANKNNVSSKFNTVEMDKYTEKELSNQQDKIKASVNNHFEELTGISGSGMSLSEMMEVIEIMDDSKEAKPDISKLDPIEKANIKKAYDAYASIVLAMAKTNTDPFTGESLGLSKEDIALATKLANLDILDMNKVESIKAIDALSNFTVNQSLAGAQAIVSMAEGNQNTNKLAEGGVKTRKLKQYFSKRIGRLLAEQLMSLPLVMERMYGKTKAIMVSRLSGLTGVINGNAKATKMSEKIVSSYLSKFGKTKPNKQEFNTAENIHERGVIAFMMRTVSGNEEAEFKRRKGWIEQSIAKLSEGTKEDKAKSEAYQEVYDKLLKDSDTIEDVLQKSDKKNIEAVNWWVNEWSKHYAQLQKTNLEVYNEILDSDGNYTPDVTKKMDEKREVDLLQSTFASASGRLDKSKSGSLIKATKPNKIPLDRYISLDFDVNNANTIQSALIDINTAKDILKLQGFLNSPALKEIIETKEDRDLFKRRIYDYVSSVKRSNHVDRSELQNLSKGLEIAAAVGVARALGGVTQGVKQTIPVMLNTLINSGRLDFSNLFDPDVRAFIDNSGMPISNRGMASQASLDHIDRLLEKASKTRGGALVKNLEDLQRFYLKLFLQNPDVFVARASFISYYKQALNKKGKKVEDWSTHELDQEAADYAQQQVDRQQNVSDEYLQGKLFTSKDPIIKIVRKTVFPFANFTQNQKARMATDMVALAARTTSKSDRVSAMRSLSGLSVEMMAFYSLRILIATGIWSAAKAWMGYDEDDEEADKRMKNQIKGSYTSMAKDLVSPVPMLDSPAIAGMNKLLNILQGDLERDTKGNIKKGQEENFEFFGKYKEGLWDDWGVLGIAADKVDDMFAKTKTAATGKYIDKGPSWNVERTLTGDDKEGMMASATLSILYNLGVLPSEFGTLSNNIEKISKKSSRKKEKKKKK